MAAGRNEARVFTSIWKDKAFTALSPSAQRMYLFLLSQSDLSFCGVISLRERRWARSAKGLTADQVQDDLKALAEPKPEPFPEGFDEGSWRPLVVIDEDTEELFVRSLIRNDGIWKIPNLLKSAREAATLVESEEIRAALLEELRRIPVEQSSSDQVRRVLADFISDLDEGSGNPSPNPSRKGDADPSPNPSGNPSPDPSQGRGESNGEVLKDSPNPCTPPPSTPARARAATPAPAEKTGEGEGDRDQTTDFQLVAEVREIRSEWTTRSIVRALNDPEVLERPAHLVPGAMLAVARDPESRAPGRLAQNGPWWHAAVERNRPAGPDWCGHCDHPDTRLVELGDGTVDKCPTCHFSRSREVS